MGGSIDLPAEVLTIVLRYVNLNGDLAQMRLVSSGLNALIWEGQHWYLRDILSRYAISQRVMKLYDDTHGVTQSTSELRYYLFFWREVAVLEALELRLKKADKTTQRPAQGESFIAPFLLWSVFTGRFRSTSAWKGCQTSAFHLRLQEQGFSTTETLRLYVHNRWELADVEALISVSSRCSSALWAMDQFEQPRRFDVSSDKMRARLGCTHRSYEGTQEALVTEFVLRNGPAWAARILFGQSTLLQKDWVPEHRFLYPQSFDTLWRTPREHTARFIAAGVVRMLWEQRSVKIEEEQQRYARERLERPEIHEVHAISAVWRGSAGDM